MRRQMRPPFASHAGDAMRMRLVDYGSKESLTEDARVDHPSGSRRQHLSGRADRGQFTRASGNRRWRCAAGRSTGATAWSTPSLDSEESLLDARQ